MPVVVHDEGELTLVNVLVSGTFVWSVRLFKNNFTPGATNVLADFTEADFQDYAPVSPTWGTPAEVSGKGEVTATDPVSFIMGTPGTTNNIYGWFITNDSASKVIASFRYADAPRAMATLGSTITELPTVQLFG